MFDKQNGRNMHYLKEVLKTKNIRKQCNHSIIETHNLSNIEDTEMKNTSNFPQRSLLPYEIADIYMINYI